MLFLLSLTPKTPAMQPLLPYTSPSAPIRYYSVSSSSSPSPSPHSLLSLSPTEQQAFTFSHASVSSPKAHGFFSPPPLVPWLELASTVQHQHLSPQQHPSPVLPPPVCSDGFSFFFSHSFIACISLYYLSRPGKKLYR